ncbi:MAG: ABC transporter ATP-binding protein/permease [Defluviitaleaceae bacterium]|nr:ABC transporter ATP-binding protein/permease [Defluviitaleaceae bacterium]
MNKQPQQAPPPPHLQGRMGNQRFMREKEKPKHFVKTILRLLSFLRGQRFTLVLIFVLAFGASAAAMIGPFLIGQVIDNIVYPTDTLTLVFVAMVILYVGDATANFFQNWVVAGASQRLVKTMRHSVFKHLQKLPVKFFDRFMHGELMSRISNDTDNVASILGTALVQLTSISITLTGVFIMMLWLSPIMTFFSLISVPLFFIVSKTIATKTHKAFRAQQASLGILNAKIEEDISGMAVIKAYGSEARAVADFAKTNEALRIAGTEANIWSGFIMPAMNVINNLSLAVIAFAGSMMAINGTITVGLIATFIAYSRQFGRPLNDLAGTYNQFQSALASCERIFEILDETEEMADPADAVPLIKTQGDIHFKNISFGYNPDNPVISNCTFHAPPGAIIALVGPTGAGKTTIVNLITRFYDSDKGEITLDGHSLNHYTRASLRRTFGIVLQDTYLFTGTIMENLRYGRPSATEAEVYNAAKIVGAHGFIANLSEQYDTLLTENSRGLSQGQRQLLAITRCILADPDILILDEATSSVDTRTEIKIQKAMSKLMEGRTSFVIAHRLRTIANADHILVIDQGQILEQGNHTELMDKKGIYQRMFDIQYAKIS